MTASGEEGGSPGASGERSAARAVEEMFEEDKAYDQRCRVKKGTTRIQEAKDDPEGFLQKTIEENT